MNLLHPTNLVFLVSLFVYSGIRRHFIQRHSLLTTKKTVSLLDRQEKWLLSGMFLSVLVLPLMYLLTPLLNFANYSLPAFVPWVGFVVIIVSLWLFWRSHADLAENWSISLEVCEGQHLITHGVYRSVRHPMYASIWLWALGQGLMLPNWLAGWSATVAFAAMYCLRIPREERLMCETFGEEYRAYMRCTGRLWPRVRRKPAATP